MEWTIVDFGKIDEQKEAFAMKVRDSWPHRFGVAVRETIDGKTEVSAVKQSSEGAIWISPQDIENAMFAQGNHQQLSALSEGRVAFELAIAAVRGPNIRKEHKS